MRCRAYSLVAASAVLVALLSDATGARGQGTGGPATEIQTIYQALTEHGVRPALIYDVEGFVDITGGARRGATYLDNLNLQLTFDLEPPSMIS